MKTLNKIAFVILLSLSLSINAQEVADFTITDVEGTDYSLYNYLDNGIPVVLDMFSRF